MKLKLTLLPEKSERMAVNYNYSVAATIYKLLRFGSPEFSEFLHNSGFKLKGKNYELFTFAVQFDKPPQIIGNSFSLNDQSVTLMISSPLVDQFIRNFVIGSIENSMFSITADDINSEFRISEIESFCEGEVNNEVKFRVLSPLVLSTGVEKHGKITNQFLKYSDDPEICSRVLNKNLKNKYFLIHGEEYKGDDLVFSWDHDYVLAKSKQNETTTRRVKILKDMVHPISIIGNMIPFYLKGNKELISIGYESGFGEKNSIGFGMTSLYN